MRENFRGMYVVSASRTHLQCKCLNKTFIVSFHNLIKNYFQLISRPSGRQINAIFEVSSNDTFISFSIQTCPNYQDIYILSSTIVIGRNILRNSVCNCAICRRRAWRIYPCPTFHNVVMSFMTWGTKKS